MVIGKLAAALLLAATLQPAGAAQSHCRTALEVQSSRNAGQVRVSVRLELAAPVQQTWDVMTDYAHASRFIRNLRSSDETPLGPNRRLVRQQGWLGWKEIGTSIRTDYEMTLDPVQRRVSGHLVAGNLRSMTMKASLHPIDASRTALDYEMNADPGDWIPALAVEGLLRQQARDSFEDLAAEMLRRSPTCPESQP